MSAKDISRFIFQPEKRYASVRMQQGRVMLDSDWNESAHIDGEEARRQTVETICAKGTSNQGFLVGSVEDATVIMPTVPGDEFPATVETYDFPLVSGSYYLGGLRFEVVPGIEERFLSQTDGLQMQIDPAAANLPVRPSVEDLTDENGNSTTRHDLVYLRAWEQCVTTVEDSELRERALGGPDTSVRIRRMRRIEVLTGVPSTCPEAFTLLKQQLTAGAVEASPHIFDEANCELKSAARLTVSFDSGDITEDPCKPKIAGGFLGAENQTIRVQLTAPDRFIWGYDNASPLYRVQVLEEEGRSVKIKFLTLPRDQAAQPLAGQAVEILPWSAILPNQEKVAELQGHLTTVATSFNPEDSTLTISTPVPQAWIDWLSTAEDKQKHFYLRLWTGGTGDADQPDWPFLPGGEAVSLEGTGLKVTFSSPGFPGDHWIIAARPNTPDVVVPWELMNQAPPVGTRFYFAPLALIRWNVQPSAESPATPTVIPSVFDCRDKFRPLCDVRGCCTVTVGDGVASHGDFDSIEVAVAHLPAEGGEICVLAGQHETNVRIVNRRNIKITGCGKQTRMIPRRNNRPSPIFEIIDSRCITLENMEMAHLCGTAIAVSGTKLGNSQEIRILHNRILAFSQAVLVVRGLDATIADNRIRLLDREGAGVAVLMLAEDSRIERNDIGVVPAGSLPPPDDQPEEPLDPNDPCADLEPVYLNPVFLTAFVNQIFQVRIFFPLTDPFRALGGIQLAAGSEQIRISENTIKGGSGNGVTLGGVVAPIEIDKDEPADAPVIDHTGRQIWGEVIDKTEKTIPGVTLVFTQTATSAPSLLSLQTTASANGQILLKAPSAEYAVSAISPGYRVDAIVSTEIEEFGVFHQITLAQVERPGLEDVLAFLHEIHIDRNDISQMGLSGIGVPEKVQLDRLIGTTVYYQAVRQTLATLGNPIVGLDIVENRITQCLQNSFDNELRTLATRRGLGGISLGFCEDTRISENRIENNGLSHINPACGIFVTFAEEIDIDHNAIADNAPRIAETEAGLVSGMRGGIVLRGASFGLEEVVGRRLIGLDTGRHAVRIHDNLIFQPAGQAVTLFVLGPLSVCHNRFNTDLSGPSNLERLSGAILILNIGGTQGFPEGDTLFVGNQTRLGSESISFTSQLIWTLDDLGYDANQSLALTPGVRLTDNLSFFINTLLSAETLRATDSRFKEPGSSVELDGTVSLISMSTQLNNTNINHGDHCIFGFNADAGRPANTGGNQMLNTTLCPALGDAVRLPARNFTVGNAFRRAQSRQVLRRD